MLRRDEFLDLVGSQNSNESLQRQLKDLESFIDVELKKNENVVKLINSTNATTKPIENGLEIVDILKTTTLVHRDITVVSTTKVTAGSNADAVSYALWEDTLKYPNNSNASAIPWIDKTFSETSVTTYTFDGKLRIKCPENTNKFVAKVLSDKYMSIGKTDSQGNFLSGFWSQSNRANTKTNAANTANKILPDGIRVLYDGTNNIVYLEFKLF
jgi:hypothetical protein